MKTSSLYRLIRSPQIIHVLVSIALFLGAMHFFQPHMKFFDTLKSFDLPIEVERTGPGIASIFESHRTKYSVRDAKPQVYRVNFSLTSLSGSAQPFILMVDDCLKSVEIDGKEIPLGDGIRQGCFSTHDLIPNTFPASDQAAHHYSVVFVNTGGPASVTIEQLDERKMSKSFAALFFCMSVTWLFGFGFGGFVERDAFRRCLLTLSLGMYLILAIKTGPFERSWDVGGHLDHVVKVLGGDFLVRSDACWECQQAPLYYWISAALANAAKTVLSIEDTLTLLSVALFMGFLVVSNRVVDELTKSRSQRRRMAALLAFFPISYIHGIRISNDLLFYFLSILALLYSLRWWKMGASKDLLTTAVITTVALFTKLTSMMIASMFLLSFLVRGIQSYRAHSTRVFLRSALPAMVVLLLGVVLLKYTMAQKSDDMLRQPGIHSSLYVESKLQNFLTFDYEKYFDNPFNNTRDDRLGRQSVWTFFLKSILWGEFSYSEGWIRTLGRSMNFCLLALLGLSLYGLALRKSVTYYFPLAALLMSGIVMLIAYRIKLPVSPTGDIRLVFPVMVPLLSGLVMLDRGDKKPGCVVQAACWMTLFFTMQGFVFGCYLIWFQTT